MPRLSVLICSLHERGKQLADMLKGLDRHGDAHIDIDLSPPQDKTVGEKRQALLEQALGEYVCYIDDDDTPGKDYLARIIEATRNGPDSIGFRGLMMVDGKASRALLHSRYIDHWHSDQGVAYRYPNHLNPVRRELALQVGFRALNAGEDGDYSHRLKPLLKTEAWAGDDPLYYYNFSGEGSTTNTTNAKFAYRNSFGGDFKLELPFTRSYRGGALDMTIGGVSVTSRFAKAPGRATGRLVIERKGDDIIVESGEAERAEFPISGHVCRVEIARGEVKVQQPTRIHVGGEEIRLS